MGEGVGGGVRKKILTSRGKAEALYEFPKIENRRFAKPQFFYMTYDGKEMECLISQEDYVLEHVCCNFSNGSLISDKSTN